MHNVAGPRFPVRLRKDALESLWRVRVRMIVWERMIFEGECPKECLCRESRALAVVAAIVRRFNYTSLVYSSFSSLINIVIC